MALYTEYFLWNKHFLHLVYKCTFKNFFGNSMLLCDFVWELSVYIKYCSLPGALDQSEGASKTWVSGFPCGSAPAWTVSLSPEKLDLNHLAMFYVPELSAYFNVKFHVIECHYLGHAFCVHHKTVSWGAYVASGAKLGIWEHEHWKHQLLCESAEGFIHKHFNGLLRAKLMSCICWRLSQC